MSDKKFIGRIGEDAAESYLRRLGYQIIDRNFRTRNGEIDIIAIVQEELPSISLRQRKTENVLVFVEVKTRLSEQFGTPFEAISYYKMKALIRAAEFYKISHKNLPEAMRLDAIAVMLNNENQILEIEHIKSIT